MADRALNLLRTILLIAIAALALSGCAGSAAPATSGAAVVTNVSVSQAYDLIKNNSGKSDFQVLDVRTADEYQGGHLAGALNIDFYSADFESRLQQLNKTGQYLVYCRSGTRSAQASKMMANSGFARINNMLGGITDWTAAGYPTTK